MQAELRSAHSGRRGPCWMLEGRMHDFCARRGTRQNRAGGHADRGTRRWHGRRRERARKDEWSQCHPCSIRCRPTIVRVVSSDRLRAGQPGSVAKDDSQPRSADVAAAREGRRGEGAKRSGGQRPAGDAWQDGALPSSRRANQGLGAERHVAWRRCWTVECAEGHAHVVVMHGGHFADSREHRGLSATTRTSYHWSTAKPHRACMCVARDFAGQTARV